MRKRAAQAPAIQLQTLAIFTNQVVSDLLLYRYGDTEGSGLTGRQNPSACRSFPGRRIPTNNGLRSIPLFRPNPTIKKL
jgi:hypothetical protein